MPQPQQCRIQAESANLHHNAWQCWILNALSGARDQTCIFMDSSQFHFHCATRELWFFFLNLHSFCICLAHPLEGLIPRSSLTRHLPKYNPCFSGHIVYTNHHISWMCIFCFHCSSLGCETAFLFLLWLKYSRFTMLFQLLLYIKVTQSDVYIHSLSYLPSWSIQVIGYSSLFYTVGPCCLSFLNVVVCIYYPQTASPSQSPLHSPATTGPFSMSASLFLFRR